MSHHFLCWPFFLLSSLYKSTVLSQRIVPFPTTHLFSRWKMLQIVEVVVRVLALTHFQKVCIRAYPENFTGEYCLGNMRNHLMRVECSIQSLQFSMDKSLKFLMLQSLAIIAVISKQIYRKVKANCGQMICNLYFSHTATFEIFRWHFSTRKKCFPALLLKRTMVSLRAWFSRVVIQFKVWAG